ncbi:hypothetical protein D5R38_22215 [Serratia marcescens]|nr:hypothetical protein D5R38_22215 [Serratia marcescens]
MGFYAGTPDFSIIPVSVCHYTLVAQQMADALIEHAARQPDGARHPLSSPAPIPGTTLLDG